MKRLLSLVLCALLLVSLVVPVYAETDPTETTAATDASTEAETEAASEESTETATEDATEAETEEATEESTEEATEESTEAATEQTTEKSTDRSVTTPVTNDGITLAIEDSIDAKVLAATASSVSINDTIKTNGSLTATPGGGDVAAADYSYQWYVSTDGNNFTKIENTSTVTGTSQTMYVARDGARKYYKVEISYEGSVVATSVAYQVTYYNALQNGSFETPKNNGTNAGPQYAENDVPHWYTTGKGTEDKFGKDIEILSVLKSDSIENFNLTETAADANLLTYSENINTTKPGGGGHGGNGSTSTKRYTGVPDGTQCAELNCEAWGALYQDVLTEPGSTLYWAFYHRGRFGFTDGQMDTMQLIIIDADGIPADWNPAGSSNNDGVQITCSANATAWQYHSGSYTVPEGQYVTRFYFVSTGSYNGSAQSTGTNATVGNYLDGIHFSSEVPAAPASYSNLTIQKNVDESIKDYVPAESFVFTVSNGTTTETVKLPTAAGEWSASLLNLDPGEWTVTETTYDVPGYTYSGTTVSGAASSNSVSAVLNMTKGQNYILNFQNNYQAARSDEVDQTFITVQKTFSGITQAEIPMDFTITVTDANNVTRATLNINNATTQPDSDATGDLVYTWKVMDLEAGTYAVTESGAEVGNYELTAGGTGSSVTTQASNMKIDQMTPVKSNKETEVNIGTDVRLIIATLTQNAGYFVWSDVSLSASQRQVVASYIGTTVDKIFFYSGDKLTDADGLIFRGDTIRYDKETGIMHFSATKQWSKFQYGTYTMEGGVNPEIAVTNTYRKTVGTLIIAKDVSGVSNLPSDTTFSFTIKGENDSHDVSVAAGGSLTTPLELPEGTYTITETKKDFENFNLVSVKAKIDSTETELLESNEIKAYSVTIAGGKDTTVTFTNTYKENDVTINYVAKVFDADGKVVTDNTTCTVSPESETVAVVTGTASGSQANSSTNDYKFEGWYSDEACTTKVADEWVSIGKITPKKESDTIWKAVTYYAKFVPNKTTLTISKSSSSTVYDSNDSFIFDVYKGNSILFTLVLKAGGSVTINDIIVGETYTVKERTTDTRYNAVSDISVTAEADGSKNVAVFTNSLKTTTWLSATNSETNTFKK